MERYAEYEDERGYLYEVPDDDGRIRVRDIDGNVVTWSDPGDDDYSEMLTIVTV